MSGDYNALRRRVRLSLNNGRNSTYGLKHNLVEILLDYLSKHCKLDIPSESGDRVHDLADWQFIEPCAMIVSLIYLERLRQTDPEFFSNDKNPEQNLVLPAMILASKFTHDPDTCHGTELYDWAVASGVDLQELKGIEWNFVDKLKWDAMVTTSTFADYLSLLEAYWSYQNATTFHVTTYQNILRLSEMVPREVVLTYMRQLLSFIATASALYTILVCSIVAASCATQPVQVVQDAFLTVERLYHAIPSSPIISQLSFAILTLPSAYKTILLSSINNLSYSTRSDITTCAMQEFPLCVNETLGFERFSSSYESLFISASIC